MDWKGLNSLLCRTIEKFLIRFSLEWKSLRKNDNKITLIMLKFSMAAYKEVKNSHNLSTTTIDLLHLMYEFGKLHKIKDEVKVHLVNDQLQKIDTNTCGIFQLYFYVNLFAPLDGSSVIHEKTLTRSTFEKLLNEIFLLDREENEKKIEQFTDETEIKKMSRIIQHLFSQQLHLSKLLTFEQVPNIYDKKMKKQIVARIMSGAILDLNYNLIYRNCRL